MLKEKALPFSIICLSASLIISAFIISNGMKHNGEYVSSGLSSISQGLVNAGNLVYNLNNNNLPSSKNTLDLLSASNYLGIETSRLIQLVNSPGSGIPHVKVDDQYIFSKTALDKWLETVKMEIK